MIGALTLDQLRVLVAIEKTGSFSAAGRELRRVQSAISHAIQTLEDTQGVQLFDRSGRTPRFTDAGRVLATQAQQILRQAEAFERTAHSIAAGLEPELSIAVDSFVPTGPVIRGLANLQHRFPDLTVTLFTEGLGAAERRVRDGSATLGLCALLPSIAQDLQAAALMQVALVPVVAPTHPLACETRPLTRDILSEHVQLILTDPLQRPGPSFSVVSPRVWRFVDIARRLEFLLAGFGWGTMPHHLVEEALESGRLVRLAIDDPAVLPGSVGLFAVHDRKRPLGIGARWLLEELQRQGWDAYSRQGAGGFAGGGPTSDS
ncbi:LysR family transcriptional regulator (plasmid) [Azospirillum humicireducens]|uniref:LysR family transcriptional regulator n=1 Tax=Azospirillum humicireducens TaxID=1226968 RepID=A0A2R4VR12_9PROT|nr:LysR family transcriptional regulator [Azospirillum humicireducens]AWB06889.1 LysR family transcriptional regulator [Azospirillum humicireducens]